MKRLYTASAVVCAASVLGYAYWKFAIPTHHVEMRSELIMLGDLDGDLKWTTADLNRLDRFRADPFSIPADTAIRADLNWNGQIEAEDFAILQSLAGAGGDPYAAESAASQSGIAMPRPRELYRYLPLSEYRVRPTYALPHGWSTHSPVAWIGALPAPAEPGRYSSGLHAALYSEAVRLDCAWAKREVGLLPAEREYAGGKIARVRTLAESGKSFDALLGLIELVEDAETLTVRNQPPLNLKLLVLRDHLREVLNSPLYSGIESGEADARLLLRAVAAHIRADLGITYDLETLDRPRDITHLENYLQRAEWQYYKSTTRQQDLAALVQFAQNDPRYLRAVSRTSRRLADAGVENHNLAMVLLFREALRVKNGDKKKAVGLLDEAIRIPYAWIKVIPRETLPGSVALDNFLLPGNKEDGADKSRHWNVFGGICLYKSAPEALDLALKREVQDLRTAGYSAEAVREFLRDMIANLNGMYHVMSVNPDLLSGDR
jgi:hypothetical protein